MTVTTPPATTELMEFGGISERVTKAYQLSTRTNSPRANSPTVSLPSQSSTGKKTALFKIDAKREARVEVLNRWPVEVNLFLCISNLNNISTVNHSFSLQGKLRLEWKATEEEHERFKKDGVNFTPDIVPRWEFRNQVEFNEQFMGYENGSQYDFYKIGDEWYMQRGSEFNVVFAESLELANYPFDTQNLKIVIESRHLCKDYIRFRPMISFPVVAFDQSNNNVPDWKIHGIVADFEPAGSDNTFSQVIYSISASRNYNAVLIRLVSFLVGIPIMAFTTFSMSPSDDLPDRLAHAMTCLLTEVAFQFVINNTLPEIPYVTWLDEVCIASFLSICFVLVQSSIIPVISDVVEPNETQLRQIDMYCFITLMSAFLLCVLYYTARAFWAVQEEKLKKLLVPREEYYDRDEETSTILKWHDSGKHLQGKFLNPALDSEFQDKTAHYGTIRVPPLTKKTQG